MVTDISSSITTPVMITPRIPAQHSIPHPVPVSVSVCTIYDEWDNRIIEVVEQCVYIAQIVPTRKHTKAA